MNNFLSTIDDVKKLENYLQHTNKTLESFDKTVEKTYEQKASRYEKNRGVFMSKQHLLELVDIVTHTKNDDLTDFNIMYDKQVAKIRFFDTGTWEESMVNMGVTQVIGTIQEYLLHAYERFLIKYAIDVDNSHIDRQEGMDYLEEYYQFIIAYDLPPFVKDKYDYEILGEEDEESESTELSERFTAVYSRQKQLVTPMQKKQMVRSVLDIIKRNTKRSTSKLNQRVAHLIKLNNEFSTIMKSLCPF